MKKAIIAIGLVGTLLTGVAFGQSQADIPKWIKITAGFWVDGLITDDEFLQAISYLIEEGIINAEPHRSCSDIVSDATSHVYAYLGASIFDDEEDTFLRLDATLQKFRSHLEMGASIDDWADQDCDTDPETLEYMRDDILLAQQFLDRLNDTATEEGDAGRTASPYSIEIVKCANTAGGYVETKGFITNHEDVEHTYKVTFTLLDAAGKPITFESGYAFDVPPGNKQAVEAIFLEDVQFHSCEATVAVS